MKLIGKNIFYNFKDEVIKFTIIRALDKAVRVRINNTHQLIWIPKIYFRIIDNKVKLNNIDWKLRSKEFTHKLQLAKKEQITINII